MIACVLFWNGPYAPHPRLVYGRGIAHFDELWSGQIQATEDNAKGYPYREKGW